MNLDEFQLQATKMNDSHLLIKAGPGTGKTFVLISKITHLINDLNINPNQILAITFTRKARDEILARINKALTKNKFNNIFTFHSFAISTLKNTGALIDESKQKQIIEQIQLQLSPNNKYKHAKINDLILQISMYKNTEHDSKDQDFLAFLSKYQNIMQINQYLDYDDVILQAIEFFKKQPIINSMYQYKYILIDEFQDTNLAQYKLIKSLLTEQTKLIAIGDEKQSIYGFRGAYSDIFSKLQKDFPNIKTIELQFNYRSCQKILDLSYKLFPDQVKLISKVNRSKCAQTEVEIIKTNHEFSEADFVLKKLSEKMNGLDLNEASLYHNKANNNVNFKDFAIIYRIHSISYVLEKKFYNSAIPYNVIGADSMFNKWHIQFFLTILKYLDTKDIEILIPIFKSKIFALSTIFLKKLSLANIAKTFNLEQFISFVKFENLKENHEKQLLEFMDFLSNLGKKSNLQNILYDILEKTNLEQSLNSRQKADVYSFIQDAERFTNRTAFLKYIETIKDNNYYDENANKITLSSIHAIKGLEFKYVFLIGFDDGIIPIQNTESIEEEKRLLFVALTRAKNSLYILTTQNRFKKPQKISRFFTKYFHDTYSIKLDDNYKKIQKRLERKKAKQSQLGLF